MRRDEDVTGFEIRLGQVQDDAGPPSTVPAETGRPASAPSGTSSRRYAPETASPSEVSTRGGVSAWYDRNASLRSETSRASTVPDRTASCSSWNVR
ncbi:hypothetical protein ACFQY4_25225 [Catellatospora bangladeshensis]|uniref:hypothetical protein n=1 Tax=Catellatospora bangladeshensis TaxID=310355 RepID=UPI0036101C4C